MGRGLGRAYIERGAARRPFQRASDVPALGAERRWWPEDSGAPGLEASRSETGRSRSASRPPLPGHPEAVLVPSRCPPSEPRHEGHQPGALRAELLRGRVLPLGAELGHRPRQQQQEPRAGGAHEPPLRHERLLLEAAGAGAGHPAGHQGEPGGDPPARHRLHLRPADRARGGGQGPRPFRGHPALPQGSRARLGTPRQRREEFVSLTSPPPANTQRVSVPDSLSAGGK